MERIINLRIVKAYLLEGGILVHNLENVHVYVMPRLVYFEDLEFVILFYEGSFIVVEIASGQTIGRSESQEGAYRNAKNNLYKKGRVGLDLYLKRANDLLEKNGFILPLNFPSILA